MKGVFITATTTDAGKTCVARGFARALARAQVQVAAIKPVETGCAPEPKDATALANACGIPSLANAPGLYREQAPVAPLTATNRGAAPPPSASQLAERVRQLAIQVNADFLIAEGAGGLLVPLSVNARSKDPPPATRAAGETIADLAAALGMPLIIVAPNRLGVLSNALAHWESARQRDLEVAGIILVRTQNTITNDHSVSDNAAVLRTMIRDSAVFELPFVEPLSNDTLANAIKQSGLLSTVLS